MTCREVADFLVDYVSGELGARVRARFERHLRLCPNCRAYLATYMATVELASASFRAGEECEVPEDLVAAIVASLEE